MVINYMEKEIKISISKTKYIYGRLRGPLTKPLIIFVHGLTGHMDEHIFYNGARYFEKHNFSSFRFNLYQNDKDARKLDQCNLKTHVHDLNLVVKYFLEKEVKKIFVVGHSYGGPTILLSNNENYQAIVLWDPSYNPKRVFTKAKYVKELNKYILKWSYGFVIGKKMFVEAKKISEKESEQIIKNVFKPIKIICAGKEKRVALAKKYYSAANQPKDFVVIKNAGHCFNENGTEDELFKQTLSWFKKYVKGKKVSVTF